MSDICVLYASSIPIEDDRDLSRNRQPWMFRQSLARFGIPAKNITLGLVFSHDAKQTWPHLLKTIGEIERDTIVLLTDAWDTFFCCGLDEIREKFLAFQRDIVFSMETNLFPVEVTRFGPIPPSPTSWRFINGGQIIGRAGALYNLFTRPDFWRRGECWCNQEAYNRWWILHPDATDFALDFHCQIFCAIWGGGQNAIRVRHHKDVRRLYNTETDSYPCSIHGNGAHAIEASNFWRLMND